MSARRATLRARISPGTSVSPALTMASARNVVMSPCQRYIPFPTACSVAFAGEFFAQAGVLHAQKSLRCRHGRAQVEQRAQQPPLRRFVRGDADVLAIRALLQQRLDQPAPAFALRHGAARFLHGSPSSPLL